MPSRSIQEVIPNPVKSRRLGLTNKLWKIGALNAQVLQQTLYVLHYLSQINQLLQQATLRCAKQASFLLCLLWSYQLFTSLGTVNQLSIDQPLTLNTASPVRSQQKRISVTWFLQTITITPTTLRTLKWRQWTQRSNYLHRSRISKIGSGVQICQSYQNQTRAPGLCNLPLNASPAKSQL